ncbi:hypothetical protein, partial [Bacillus cytotoxicus]|uniref:hypothetical protein n=1 Tax=Bacillus cytotoxicus TaxID=580165 RepID=UPI003B763322
HLLDPVISLLPLLPLFPVFGALLFIHMLLPEFHSVLYWNPGVVFFLFHLLYILICFLVNKKIQ